MLVWINGLLFTIGILLAVYFLGGCYGVIKGELSLLSGTATGKSIRLGSLILISTSTIAYVLLEYSHHLTERRSVNELFRYSIILLLIIAGGAIAKRLVKNLKLSNENWSGQKSQSRTPLMEYGDKRCVKCGTVYTTTLTFMDPREVKVASCRVCPANQIYTICAQCADVEQVSRGACPFCSANNQWETRGMVAKLQL